MMLKAGFSRVDVTPPLGSYISGYFTDRYAKGVLDPIQLNALAVSDGDKTVLIVIADFIGVNRKLCEKIRKMIAKRTGLDTSSVVLSALHQHTSIVLGNRNGRENLDPNYLELLYCKYCDVAQMALDDMSDATLGFGMEETAEPIAFIRRYLMTDGTVIGHPLGRQSEIVRRIGEADNRVRLLRFAREGKNDIAFVNFCTHPDTMGGEMFSADWPGFVRKYVEKDLGGVSCLLLNGVQGDSNHCDYLKHAEMIKGYAHSEYMGRMIADTVLRLWESGRAMKDEKVGARIGIVSLPTRTDGMEDYEACKKMLEELNNGTCKTNPSGAERGRVSRIVRMQVAPLFQKLPITVMRIGELFVVGFGGEPFTDYAREVRKAFPEKELFTACCANGDEGYLPSTEDFGRVTYESSASPFPSDLEEHCVGMALDLIASLS